MVGDFVLWLPVPGCRRLSHLSSNSNAAFGEEANYDASKNFELKVADRLDTPDIEADKEHSSIIAVDIRASN